MADTLPSERRVPTEYIEGRASESIVRDEHGSGGYRRDKDQLLKWMLALIAIALIAAVIRHEVALGSIGAKLDTLLEYFRIEQKK
jgi:hypothetical protein